MLRGSFPAGRPAWEEAGAVLTDEVTPLEDRKLWLLNGGHCLPAYLGGVRGHADVASAVADPACRGWLERWWDTAAAHLTLSADQSAAYREALRERFANPRIRHRLERICSDGAQKLLGLASGHLAIAVPRSLAALDPSLADDDQLVGAVRGAAGHLHGPVR